MQTCIKCKVNQPEKNFRLIKKESWQRPRLSQTCSGCERPPLIYCAYCGRPLYSSVLHKISTRLYECTRCHENTLAIIEKNIILKITWKLNQLISKTTRMPNNLIGNLRDQLFETIEDLRSGKVTPDVASSITDVARTIIDSARVENEFIKLTESAGSGFIPLQANGLKDVKQIGQ